MAPPEVHHLFNHPIADHSFSADRQTLAVARDNNIELYQRSGGKFQLKDELTGHDKLVTGVDIAPNSGKIVTCSQGTSSSAIYLHNKQPTHKQTVMPTFGSPPAQVGSQHSSFSASTAPPLMFAGHHPRPNSL